MTENLKTIHFSWIPLIQAQSEKVQILLSPGGSIPQLTYLQMNGIMIPSTGNLLSSTFPPTLEQSVVIIPRNCVSISAVDPISTYMI